MSEDRSLIPVERIEQSILVIRTRKVMLDTDLAALYGVETGQLVRAVKRISLASHTILCFSSVKTNSKT